MADTTRLIGPDDLGGLWIEGTLTTARPVDTIVRNTLDGELYVSTNAVVATYTQLTNSGSGSAPTITSTAADPYAVLATDDYVLLTGTAQVVDLIAGASHVTKVLTIKDKAGTAAASPITITPNGAETIDGAASLTIDANYAGITLVFAGTDWSQV